MLLVGVALEDAHRALLLFSLLEELDAAVEDPGIRVRVLERPCIRVDRDALHPENGARLRRLGLWLRRFLPTQPAFVLLQPGPELARDPVCGGGELSGVES